MQKIPLVSVIVPVFNEEKYLDACLSSLFDQTYPRFEIIVVDDGSDDASTQIAKNYPVRILTQKHSGPGSARNKGAQNAKGEILIFSDADMKYDKNYMTKLIEPIVAKRTIGTFVKDELVANYDNIWSRCWSTNSGLPINRRLPIDYPETESGFRAILKKYFQKSGGFDTNVGYTDDGSLSRKLQLRAVNAPGAISYHYNPSTLSEVFYSARWVGRAEIFNQNIISFLRYSPINSLRVSLKYLFSGASIAIIPFKLVYDFGMLVGIFLSSNKTAK